MRPTKNRPCAFCTRSWCLISKNKYNGMLGPERDWEKSWSRAVRPMITCCWALITCCRAPLSSPGCTQTRLPTSLWTRMLFRSSMPWWNVLPCDSLPHSVGKPFWALLCICALCVLLLQVIISGKAGPDFVNQKKKNKTLLFSHVNKFCVSCRH